MAGGCRGQDCAARCLRVLVLGVCLVSGNWGRGQWLAVLVQSRCFLSPGLRHRCQRLWLSGELCPGLPRSLLCCALQHPVCSLAGSSLQGAFLQPTREEATQSLSSSQWCWGSRLGPFVCPVVTLPQTVSPILLRNGGLPEVPMWSGTCLPEYEDSRCVPHNPLPVDIRPLATVFPHLPSAGDAARPWQWSLCLPTSSAFSGRFLERTFILVKRHHPL